MYQFNDNFIRLDIDSDGNSAREIARELDISHTQVNRLLKEMFNDGTLNKRGTGTVPKVTDVPNVPDVPPVSTDVPDKKPKKKRCPACGYMTFVRYIDTEPGPRNPTGFPSHAYCV